MRGSLGGGGWEGSLLCRVRVQYEGVSFLGKLHDYARLI